MNEDELLRTDLPLERWQEYNEECFKLKVSASLHDFVIWLGEQDDVSV